MISAGDIAPIVSASAGAGVALRQRVLSRQSCQTVSLHTSAKFCAEKVAPHLAGAASACALHKKSQNFDFDWILELFADARCLGGAPQTI